MILSLNFTVPLNSSCRHTSLSGELCRYNKGKPLTGIVDSGSQFICFHNNQHQIKSDLCLFGYKWKFGLPKGDYSGKNITRIKLKIRSALMYDNSRGRY